MSRKMNLLIIGPAESIFTKEFCRNVLDEQSMKITLLTQKRAENFGEFYKESGINEITWPIFFEKGLGKNLFRLYEIRREWEKLERQICDQGDIDVLHVHYVEPLHLIYFWALWKKAKKRVLTFWGSDILQTSKIRRKLLTFFLRKSDRIVFMIPNQYKFFQNIYKNRYAEKISIIDFGNDVIDEIDKVERKFTKDECKQYFGLPLDKIIVHIGYNASQMQQHDMILKEMKNLPLDLLQKIKLVIHVSYGFDKNYNKYKEKLIEIMNDANMDYMFCDKYLKSEELAIFRKTCDLFVYGILSDSRSASPLEYVYSGSQFICPSWLKENYELLDRAGAEYILYDDFSQLNEKIELCIRRKSENKGVISAESKKLIRNETSWKALAPKWKEIYK